MTESNEVDARIKLLDERLKVLENLVPDVRTLMHRLIDKHDRTREFMQQALDGKQAEGLNLFQRVVLYSALTAAVLMSAVALAVAYWKNPPQEIRQEANPDITVQRELTHRETMDGFVRDYYGLPPAGDSDAQLPADDGVLPIRDGPEGGL